MPDELPDDVESWLLSAFEWLLLLLFCLFEFTAFEADDTELDFGIFVLFYEFLNIPTPVPSFIIENVVQQVI